MRCRGRGCGRRGCGTCGCRCRWVEGQRRNTGAASPRAFVETTRRCGPCRWRPTCSGCAARRRRFARAQQFGFDVGGKDASQFVALQRSEAALECPGLGEVVLHKTGIAVAMSRLGPRLGAVLIGQFDPIGHAPFKNFSGRSHHLRKRGCSSMNLSRTLGFANPRARRATRTRRSSCGSCRAVRPRHPTACPGAAPSPHPTCGRGHSAPASHAPHVATAQSPPTTRPHPRPMRQTQSQRQDDGPPLRSMPRRLLPPQQQRYSVVGSRTTREPPLSTNNEGNGEPWTTGPNNGGYQNKL